MTSLETNRNAALVAAGLSLMISACGGGSPTPMTDDGGFVPTGDGGVTDATASDFDPSTTYPGEGDACRLSMECGDRQICVDDACVRHERIDPAEIRLGEWRLASEDASRRVDLREDDEEFRNEMMVLVPGRTHPVVVSTGEFSEGCRLARVDRDWLSTGIAGVDCLSVDSTSDGGLLIGAVRREDLRPLIVVLANDLTETARIEVDVDVLEEGRVTRGLGARLGGVTGILADGGDILASVGVFSRDDRTEHDGVIVVRVRRDGSQVLEHGEISGGRGWLVRDEDGVSVVTTVWPWEDPPFLGGPDRLSTSYRYLVTDLETGEESESYVGSAQTAWLFRPSEWEWSVALYERATPDCLIRFIGRRGLGIVNVSDESFRRRACIDSLDESPSGYNGDTNGGRSAMIPASLFGWVDTIWTVTDFGYDIRDGGVEVFGLVDQSTMDWVGFDAEQDFFAPVGISFARFGTTSEAIVSWSSSKRLGLERRLERR